MLTSKQAETIVARIEADILDRRGLKWEWRQTDEDTLNQIREKWRLIILSEANDE